MPGFGTAAFGTSAFGSPGSGDSLMELFVGLNNTGSEKGPLPGVYGTDYRFDSQATLNYLSGLGDRHVRVMLRWERIQPTLGAALNATELQRLNDYVTRAAAAGLKVIVVVNKGARYNELPLGDASGPTQAQFVDLWTRMSAAFGNNPAVLGYGNNEPHDLPDSFASYTNVATFDATQENWTSEAGSGVTTSRSTTTVHDGAGSLSCQKTVSAGVFQSLRVTDNVTTTHNESAGGYDYACWVFCPAGETGWFAQIDITDATGANVAGTAQSLTAGTWNYVSDTFTSGQVAAMQRKIVQIHSLSPTAGSKTFFLDSIVQAVRYTGVQRWQDADRAAAAAVRGGGDTKLWFAAGYGWAAAAGWAARNGPPWHTAAGVVYEAHLYYDNDHSGTYTASYTTENANSQAQGWASVQARALAWANDFLGWLASFHVDGMIGETGWPASSSWNTVGGAVLSAVVAAKVSALVWAVGEIEGTGYPLTPWYSSAGAGTPVDTPGLQAPVVQPYFTAFGSPGTYGSGYTGGYGPPQTVTPGPSPSPAAPSAPATWQWVVGPWRTGPDTLLSAARNRKITWRRTGRHEASFDLDGTDPAAAAVAELVADLWVIRAGSTGPASCLFRGRIGPTGDDVGADTHDLSVSAGDYRAVLDRRQLWEGGQLSWTDTDQAAILWGLVGHTQAQPGGNLGIVRGVGRSTGVVRARNDYPAGKAVGEAADQLAAVDNGFDWDVTPAADPRNPALYLDVFYPSRGTDRGVVLDLGGRLAKAKRLLDPGQYANAVRGTGKDGLAAVRREAADVATRAEGRWDSQMADPDLLVQQTVVERTVRTLADRQVLTPAWTVTFAADGWGGPDDVWLGDPVTLVVKSGRLDVVASYQVQEITAAFDDNDTLAASAVLGAVEHPNRRWALRRVDQRLKALERR